MRFAWPSSLFVLIALTTTLRGAAAEEKAEDVKLLAFFKEYLEAAFRAEPLMATRMGDRRFDNRLDDISDQARDEHLERHRKWLDRLPERIDYNELSRNGQIDFEIFRHYLQRTIWLAETFEPFKNDPRVYGDYLTESVYLPLAQSTLPKAKNLANIKERMAQIPEVVKIARTSIGRPPRVKVETAILQTKGAIGFYKEGLFRMAGEPTGEGELGELAKAVVAALERHLEFLQTEVLPRSDRDSWRIGRRRFTRKLELDLDAGLSATEVLREAESEADRVEREMAIAARYLWTSMFPDQPVPPDDETGRREMVRNVLGKIGEDHSTTDGLVGDARASVADIKTFIAKKDILRLPDPDRCKILEMPEFKRGNSVAYLEAAAPLDPNAPSEYAISPPPADWSAARAQSFLQEYNHAMLQILTIHEGYPGHYVQLEYANRCPSLIRRVLSSGAFAEGWAVYTEQMMLDQGFGNGDLKLRLQQLKFYLRAVVNAILDHRMHCNGMTDEEAMELLVGRAFQTEGEAVGKIIRSKQTSCQLSTYFVGRTAFYRLRLAISREQGDRFDLGRFHEATLAHGTLPVKYLPELARARLAEPR
jgi:uncharacterized protein (DUF885 family)